MKIYLQFVHIIAVNKKSVLINRFVPYKRINILIGLDELWSTYEYFAAPVALSASVSNAFKSWTSCVSVTVE